jgi:hypothetical protein
MILVVDMEGSTWWKLIGLVVFITPCIKLRVTCVYVLLMVLMNPSFQSGSLKTMVLIIEY